MIARTVVEPEESAAEKIYATLRECREQADPKKQKGVKMQGYLVRENPRFTEGYVVFVSS
jgi:Ras GTPase-activating protein 1